MSDALRPTIPIPRVVCKALLTCVHCAFSLLAEVATVNFASRCPSLCLSESLCARVPVALRLSGSLAVRLYASTPPRLSARLFLSASPPVFPLPRTRMRALVSCEHFRLL